MIRFMRNFLFAKTQSRWFVFTIPIGSVLAHNKLYGALLVVALIVSVVEMIGEE